MGKNGGFDVRRFFKWLGIGVGALVALLVAFVGFLYLTNWDWARGIANAQGSKAAGRQFAIDGPLEVHFGRITHVHAEQIRLANADWSKEPNMVEMAALDFSIDLLQLLRGRIDLPELTLTKPKIVLEKPDAKRKNWDMSSATPGGAVANTAVPKKRTQVPVIGQLVIDDGQISYTDVPAKLAVHSKISTAVGTGDDKERKIRLDSQGTVENEKFTLKMEGGSILSLRDPKHPYPLGLDLKAGNTVFKAVGTLMDPLQMAGIDLHLDVRGDSMSKIFPFTGIPLPPTPPFQVSGRLQKKGEVWSFDDAKGQMGGSDLEGNLAYDGSKPKPDIKIDVTSRLLDFKDLAGFVGGGDQDKEQKAETKDDDRALPDLKLNLERFRSANMDARFKAQKIAAPNGMPLENMDTHFVLKDGLLTVDPLKFGVAEGQINGKVALDGRKDLPKLETDLQLQHLSLKQFFKDTRFAQLSEGRIGGQVKLAGTGHSTAEVLAGGNGRLSVTMSGGQISALMMDAASLDVAKAIVRLLGDKPTPLRCAVADFRLDRGVANSEIFLVDTGAANINGQAIIDFRNEGLDVRFTGSPKKPSPFVTTTPITIGGTMKHPAIGIDPSGAIVRGVVAAALGAAFPPLAIIPFIEAGLGKDAPCQDLIARAQEEAANANPKAIPPGQTPTAKAPPNNAPSPNNKRDPEQAQVPANDNQPPANGTVKPPEQQKRR